MKVQVVDNTERLQAAIARLMADPRRDRGEVMRRQAVLLGKEVIKWTPKPNGKAGEARKIIDFYFARAARPLKAQNWDSPHIRRLIRAEDVGTLETIFRNTSGSLRNAEVKPWSKDIVYSAMDSRGRVTRARNVLTFNNGSRRADLKRARAAAGKAKGGWASGVTRYGGSVPGWIATHAGEGTSNNALTGPQQFVEVINRSRWAGSVDSGRIVDTAIKIRADTILRGLEAIDAKRLARL